MTATATAPAPTNGAIAAQSNENLPVIARPRLPFHPAVEERFGIDRSQWKALVEAIFPLASSIDSVILALSYCKARKLDPFKRNVHIVPIWNSELNREVDTVWPGIGELRTTAFRTGQYAGRGATVFGPDMTRAFEGTVGKGQYAKQVKAEVTFPEWAQVTLFRMVGSQRVEFVGPRVFWLETYATRGRSDVPNDMWESRPRGQLDKCAEAAALRSAFPEEIGSDMIAEEIAHQRAEQVAAENVQRGAAGLAKRLEARPQSTVIDDPRETMEEQPQPSRDPAVAESGDAEQAEPKSEQKKPAAAAPEFTGKSADDARKAWSSLCQEAHNATGAEGEELFDLVIKFIDQCDPERETPFVAADLTNKVKRDFIIDKASKATKDDWAALSK